MPRIRQPPQKQIGERVVNNIRAYGAARGCRYDYEIAKKANIPMSTFSDKMANPRRLKLEDMVMIAEAFKIPIQNLFIEMKGRDEE